MNKTPLMPGLIALARGLYWSIRLKLRYIRLPSLHFFARKKTLWGLPIECDTSELVGNAIHHDGFFDIEVCEVLWRLAEPGSLVLDVGANLGLMTGLLAKKVGSKGQVISFEPHPEIYKQLRRNTESWKGLATIEPLEYAVSNERCQTKLYIPAEFTSNRGTATMTHADNVTEVAVQCVTLDSITGDRIISVAKFDIQGHEFQALIGWQQALSRRLVKNIVYEDSSGYPCEVSRLLEGYGYSIFKLEPGFFGPKLNIDPSHGQHFGIERDYLATLDAAEAIRILSPSGWQCSTSGTC